MDCINVFLDCVSHQDFQHNIMNWSTLLLLALTYKQGNQEGLDTKRIVYKFRSSRPEVLNKNSCSKNFGNISQKH